ncbi:MAG: hypothetical protein ABL877_02510 [Thiobacillus sp.]
MHFLVKAGLLALLCLPFSAMAAGTAAGDSISNHVDFNYSIEGIPQPTIGSSPTGNSSGSGVPTEFVVDRRIDLIVIENDSTFTGTFSGQSNAVTAFTVTNLGNGTQDFALAATNLASGGVLYGSPDNFNTTACLVFADSNANNTYDPLVDTQSFLDEVPADANRTAFVVCSMPGSLASGDQANIELVATVRAGNGAGIQGTTLSDTAGTDMPNVVDIVFADAAGLGDGLRDGSYTARDAYRVGLAVSILKQRVSPLNDADLIPGAIVTWQLQLNLTGSGVADNLVLSDPLPSELIYVPGSAVLSGNIACLLCTDAADTDPVQFSLGALSATLGNVTAPASFTLIFNTQLPQ